MTRRHIRFYNRDGAFGMIALAMLLLLTVPKLHAQTFGVLNTPGGDSATDTDQSDQFANKSLSADAWIALAETSSGDGTTTCQAGSKAAEYEGFAEAAYDHWISTDYGDSVNAVSIPVQWGLYQPQWNNGSPTSDACYKLFITDMVDKYAAAGYKIALTVSVNHGPSWLANEPSGCPNCQYQGQPPQGQTSGGFHPVSNGTLKDPNGNVTATYYIANIVWDQQVRNLARPFIQDALETADAAVAASSPNHSKAQVDFVRIGISENGETRFPLAFNCSAGYDLQWWAFDGAAQSRASDHARPQEIGDPPDCLFGWYPGYGDPYTSRPTYCQLPNITREQASRDWWSWYFNSLADGLAFMYNQFRNDGFTGTIAFVTPGSGTRPDLLYSELNLLWNDDSNDNNSYEQENRNETVNSGSAWFILYDEIVWDLKNKWNNSNIGSMWIDHSSVAANADPATVDDQTMNPVALCGHNGPDLHLGFSPMPSSSTAFELETGGFTVGTSPDPFKDWSTIRQMRFYAYIQGNLPFMGENPGNNPAIGTYSSSYGYATGMNDVFTLYNSCGLQGLFWAFDNELHSGGGDNISMGSSSSIIKQGAALACSGGGGGSFPGPDASITDYCTNINNGNSQSCQ